MEMDIRCFNDCNMDCDFCARKSQELVNTNKSAIIKSLNNLLDTDCNPEGIGLTGGEPLLDEVFVKKLISIIQEKRPHCPIAIATNGSLINDNWVEYFNKNNIKLGISFHGIIGKKSIFEAMAISQNPSLIGNVLKLRNFVLKRVVLPFESFASDVCDLNDVFNTYFEISLDITKHYNISALLHFQNELRKITKYDSSICNKCTFNYTVKHCGFDQISILNDGSFKIKSCSKTDKLSWDGCSILLNKLSPEEFKYFIQITDNFKEGLI